MSAQKPKRRRSTRRLGEFNTPTGRWRVDFLVDEKVIRFKRWHGRKTHRISLLDAFATATGQLLLPPS